jgi:hypothetical protein
LPANAAIQNNFKQRGSNLQVNQRLMMGSDSDTLFEGTPTVLVPNEPLKSFAATDLPLIIATDHRGIIRSNQNAPHDALTPVRDADRIVRHTLSIRRPNCVPPEAAFN